MKIYVLTDGDYPDYHIIGVFTSKEMADKAKVIAGGDIEEWEADEIGKDNRFRFSAYIRKSGTVISTDCSFYSGKYDNSLNEVKEFVNSREGYSCYSVYVMAEDKEHAIKIASDLIAQYKAGQ